MSTYEKIASGIIVVLVVIMLGFSFRELTERKEAEHTRGPDFSQSMGDTLRIGIFTTVLDQQSSGPLETNCTQLQPVIVGTLHDIDQHLEDLGVYKPGVFEVNQQTLDLFCHQNASLTLSSDKGSKLLLVKQPFIRKIPHGGAPSDIGTDVRIDATVITPGAVPPANPTTYGEELIPDTYLDSIHT